MRHSIVLLIAGIMLCPALVSAKKIKKEAPKEGAEIHWLSIEEIQVKMMQNPKKVYVDVYTDWCGWCKKMEATTFRNPELVKYINNNYYCLRLDAERKDTFMFQGKKYYFDPAYKANTFAVELMKGQMSYPTSILMTENFQNPTPIAGYHDVKEMEMFLSYFGDNIFKHQNFADFQKSFVSRWDHGQKPDMTPPPGH